MRQRSQYRGASLIIYSAPLGPCSRTVPRARGGGAVSYERGTPVVVLGPDGGVSHLPHGPVQGYLAHQKQPLPLETPQGPRLSPTVGC